MNYNSNIKIQNFFSSLKKCTKKSQFFFIKKLNANIFNILFLNKFRLNFFHNLYRNLAVTKKKSLQKKKFNLLKWEKNFLN